MLTSPCCSLRVVLASAVALCALALAVPAASHAAKRMEFMLQDDGVLLSRLSYFDRDAGYKRLRQLGVTRLRLNAVWLRTVERDDAEARREPHTVHYDFAALDDAIKAARKHRIRVQLTLTGPGPRWSAGNTSSGRIKNPKAKQFGRWAGVVARRYRRKVDIYSVWNEPNHKGWLQPVHRQGRLYRALYEAAYQRIKDADRTAKVLIGETAPYASKKGVATPPLEFLRDVACVDRRYKPLPRRCKPLYADGYAHHPYDFERAPNRRRSGSDTVTMATLSRLTKALDKLRGAKALRTPKGRSLDLWLTEFGYFASHPGKVFSERTRAKYLVRGFQMAQRNTRVRAMLQFLLVSPPSGFRFDTGLIKADNRRTHVFSALAAWASKAKKRKQIR